MPVESRSPEAGVTGRCESPDMVLGTNIQSTAKIASDISYSAISPAPKNAIKFSKQRYEYLFLRSHRH